MFTGIVKDIGKIVSIRRHPSYWKIGIASQNISAGISESIAVNGACLTVVGIQQGILFFDVVNPTLDISNLKRLKPGSYVNLETSLGVSDKIDGHFVLGHIDCELKVKALRKKGGFYILEVYNTASQQKYIVPKGSIAVNGVSLTIAEARKGYFSVNIIPYTYPIKSNVKLYQCNLPNNPMSTL